VEDVVTSGGQLLESCAALRERGGDLRVVLSVIDRQQGGREALEAAGLDFRPVFTMKQLAAAAA
jgi:orotate phosphoribosyltransferase